MRLGNKSTKRGNNEAKFKNRLFYEHFFKTKNFKILKNHYLIAKRFWVKLVKVILKAMGPVFGQTKPWKRTKDAEKLKKLQTICENTNYWSH